MGDLKYALRMFAKSPGFATLAILTLALGIGANTAIFTVANALMLRPLPYKDPDRLVRISTGPNSGNSLSYPYLTALATNRSFESVAANGQESFNLSGRGEAQQIAAQRVTANFFDVLGTQPEVGRTFTAAEDEPGGAQVAVISDELWAQLFNRNPNALGQHLSLDANDYTVIGVLPPKFSLPILGQKIDIFAPRIREMSIVTPQRIAIGGMYFQAFGRLKSGVSAEQAQAETKVIYQQYKRDKPGNFDAGVDVIMTVDGLQQDLVANVRPTLLMFSAAVGFVLLIACANVASLLLARALGRSREFAVRTALGASRGTLIRLLLVESVVLAVIAGAAGVGLGIAGTRVLSIFSKSNFPQLADVSMDLRVLGFTLVISIFSGILFGLAPSLKLSRPDLNSVLRDEGRGMAGSRHGDRVRSILVVAQVALSTVLLIGSALLIRSFVRLRDADPGFKPEGTLTMQTYLPPTRFAKPQEKVAYYSNALAKLQSAPGVQSASISTALPVVANHGTPFLFEGQPAVPLGKRPIALIQSISPDYFKTMGIVVTAGRAFDDHDQTDTPPVVIVNQHLVAKYWPNENPIGKHVVIGNLPKPFEVVGVAADAKNQSLAQPAGGEVYVPYPQLPSPLLYLSIRTRLEPHSMVSAVRAAAESADLDQPLSDIYTMEERLESASASPRFTMLLIGIFSGVAFALAAVGIYGVIAYSVAQRTAELGVRIALGAARADIFRLVIGNGLLLTLAGVVIGLVGSIALTRLITTMLYDTSATDPVSFALSAAAFLAIAALASYVPARRATRIDPAIALRS